MLPPLLVFSPTTDDSPGHNYQPESLILLAGEDTGPGDKKNNYAND